MNKFQEHEPAYFTNKISSNDKLYNVKTKQIEKGEPLKTPNYTYQIIPGYELTKDGFQKYEQDFKKWCEELKNSKVYPIVYTSYYNDYLAINQIFKDQVERQKLRVLQKSITLDDFKHIKRCNNGNHSYLNEKYNDKIVKCYGYDYSGFYPWLLSSAKLLIPVCKGRNEKLKSLDGVDLNKPAFYRCKITYTNKNLCRVFQFSKDDEYTNLDIQYLYYLHKNMPEIFKEGDITISMIDDGEPNAYIYDKWFTGYEIFKKWYDNMSALKEEYPNNMLIKNISSRLWGYLSKFKKIYDVDESEIAQMESSEAMLLILSSKCNQELDLFYTILNKDDPGPRFCLIKPFLAALGRIHICKAMYKLDPTLDHVVRVCCDDIVLDKKIKVPNTKNFKLLKPEKKTTGNIIFRSRFTYYNIDKDLYVGYWTDKSKNEVKEIIDKTI